jgi:hypothetical protein
VHGRLEFLKNAYLSIDRRVLAVFRITYGLVLSVELLRRGLHLKLLYSNDGVISNHYLLFRPRVEPQFSIYNAFSTPEEVTFAFILTGLVFACYTLGLFTRVMQVLALVCLTSLNQRNLYQEDGGVSVLILSGIWTLFMPLGDRYSLDALRKDAMRATVKERVIQRRARAAPFLSLAVLAILLQVATIYAFNALHKTGVTWKRGEAVHWVLWQSRAATPLADWVAHREPGWFSPLLTYGTIAIESLMPALVLVPWERQRTRILAFVLAVLLHTGIALFMTLGPFSYAMMALVVLVLPASALEAVGRPLVRRWWRPVARARAKVVRFVAELRADPRPLPAPTPARAALSGFTLRLREACIALVMVASIIQVTRDNRFFGRRYKLHQPAVFEKFIMYTRMMQGWQMFAPDAPRDDGMVVIDAVTASGRHIDPFTGKEPDFEVAMRGPLPHPMPVADMLYAMHYEGERPYVGELEAYLRRWHELTGRPESDRIIRYEGWFVSHNTPPPGSKQHSNIQKKLIFSGQ